MILQGSCGDSDAARNGHRDANGHAHRPLHRHREAHPGKRVECRRTVRSLTSHFVSCPPAPKSWCPLLPPRPSRRLTPRTTSMQSPSPRPETVLATNFMLMSRGTDPAGERKQAGRKVQTIGDLADLYIERWANHGNAAGKPTTTFCVEKVLSGGGASERSSTSHDATCADLVERSQTPALHCRESLWLRCCPAVAFAPRRELIVTSPAVRIPKPGVEVARDRVLTVEELRALWATFDAFDAPMAALSKLHVCSRHKKLATG